MLDHAVDNIDNSLLLEQHDFFNQSSPIECATYKIYPACKTGGIPGSCMGAWRLVIIDQ